MCRLELVLADHGLRFMSAIIFLHFLDSCSVFRRECRCSGFSRSRSGGHAVGWPSYGALAPTRASDSAIADLGRSGTSVQLCCPSSQLYILILNRDGSPRRGLPHQLIQRPFRGSRQDLLVSVVRHLFFHASLHGVIAPGGASAVLHFDLLFQGRISLCTELPGDSPRALREGLL